MDRAMVTSTNVRSVGYDLDTLTLEVEFHAKEGDPLRVYRYCPVDPTDYAAMVDPANSAGRMIGWIKNDPSISCERVEVPANA